MGSKHYFSQYDVIYLHNGLLYRQWESRDAAYVLHQLILPKKYCRKICQLLHDSAAMCHQGLRRTKEQVRARFYWFHMNYDLAHYIAVCEKCQLRKRPAKTPRAPLCIAAAGFPNERVNMDICGPVIQSHQGNKYVLVITDTFTKYTVAAPLPDQRARTIAVTFMEKWALVFGFPYQCHSDQGSNFTSVLWARVCEELAIEKTQTTAYHPEGNSQCERFNSTLMTMLYSVLKSYKDWDARISYVTFAYNSTPHKATKYSPYYLMFGRRPFLEVDVGLPRPAIVEPLEPESYVDYVIANLATAFELTRHNTQREAEVIKRAYDKKSHGERFKVGDVVLLKKGAREPFTRKLTAHYSGKYFVVSVFRNSTYRIVRDDCSPPKVVHHNRLVGFRAENPEDHKPAWLPEAIARFALRTANNISTQTGQDDTEVTEEHAPCRICHYERDELHWRHVKDGVCDVCRHLQTEEVRVQEEKPSVESLVRKSVVVRYIQTAEAVIETIQQRERRQREASSHVHVHVQDEGEVSVSADGPAPTEQQITEQQNTQQQHT
jgi:transposase InsO family protein